MLNKESNNFKYVPIEVGNFTVTLMAPKKEKDAAKARIKIASKSGDWCAEYRADTNEFVKMAMCLKEHDMELLFGIVTTIYQSRLVMYDARTVKMFNEMINDFSSQQPGIQNHDEALAEMKVLFTKSEESIDELERLKKD